MFMDGIGGILVAWAGQVVIAILLVTVISLGTAAIALHRRGKIAWARGMGLTSALLGLLLLGISLAIILPTTPPVDPSVFPSLNFDFLSTPTR